MRGRQEKNGRTKTNVQRREKNKENREIEELSIGGVKVNRTRELVRKDEGRKGKKK